MTSKKLEIKIANPVLRIRSGSDPIWIIAIKKLHERFDVRAKLISLIFKEIEVLATRYSKVESLLYANQYQNSSHE